MAKKTKEQIDKEVEEQIALVLQGFDPRLVADVSKEDFELPEDAGLTPYDIDRQAEKNNLKKYLNAEALEFVPPDGQDVSGAQPPKIDDYAPFVPMVPTQNPFPKKTLDEMVDEAMNSNVFNVRNLYDHKNREGGTSDVARVLKDIPGFVPGFSKLPPFKGQEKDTSPIGLYSGLSVPGKRIMEFQPEGPSYYPYRNELPEDEPESSKQEVPQQVAQQAPTAQQPMVIMRNPANFEAISRQNTALWDYAVYRAANGDRSLFDKLVSDAEARKQKKMDQEFQAAGAEENRQATERQNAVSRADAESAAKKSAEKKANRLLAELGDEVMAFDPKKASISDTKLINRIMRELQFALEDAGMDDRFEPMMEGLGLGKENIRKLKKLDMTWKDPIVVPEVPAAEGSVGIATVPTANTAELVLPEPTLQNINTFRGSDRVTRTLESGSEADLAALEPEVDKLLEEALKYRQEAEGPNYEAVTALKDIKNVHIPARRKAIQDAAKVTAEIAAAKKMVFSGEKAEDDAEKYYNRLSKAAKAKLKIKPNPDNLDQWIITDKEK